MMPQKVKAAFDFEGVVIALDRLLPTRTVSETEKQSVKYRSLHASIRAVGVVEPLSVFPQPAGKFLVLDGHARAEALKDLGDTEAPCLIATQDEGYTYNKRVNRISPIQANRMILKALDAGVPEERIAQALNLAVKTVLNNRRFLQDICPEVVVLLQDKHVAHESLTLLKKVKPLRQIEIAEIMIAAGTYAATYARALVMTTPKEQLVNPETPKKIPGVKPGDFARIEHEMRVQEMDFRRIDETYNEQIMTLTIARGYLRSLLENGRVVRFLAQNFREFLFEFQRIVELNGLDG